jgi:hypothetical protein
MSHATISPTLTPSHFPRLSFIDIPPLYHYDDTINATPYAAGPCAEVVPFVLNYIYFEAE